MSRRTRTQNVWEGELNAQLNPGVLSVDLVTTTGITAPMYVTLAPENPTVEILKVISIVGNTVTFDQRNLEGSSGDQTHPVGTKVRATFTKQMLDDVFDDVEELEADDVAHAGAADPHPNYILAVNHSSSGDPHTQYLKESDFTKAAIDALNINAGTLDGVDSTGFATSGHTHTVAAHDHATLYAPLSHVGSGGSAHADATTSVDGFMTAADKTKLNTIETGADQNQMITAGAGLSGSPAGSTNGDMTLSHADTSSQPPVINQTGAVVFNGITLDTYGHVTALSTRQLTAANIGAAATSHTHDDRYFTETEADGRYVLQSTGVIDAATLLLSTSKVVIRDLVGSVALSNGDGNRIIYGSGASGNEVYLGGVPFSPGAFQVECDESGSYRRIKYDTLASSRRFKQDEEAYSIDPTQLRSLAGWLRSFSYKADPNGTRRVNYIVEDVAHLLSSEAVRYDDEGLPLKFDANWMIAALIEGYIQLSDRLDALT